MDSDLPFLQRDLASQVRRWIEWDRKDRDQQRIRTYGDTQIITLPVPIWPTHAQFEAWIETMEATAARIEALEAELAEKEAELLAERQHNENLRNPDWRRERITQALTEQPNG